MAEFESRGGGRELVHGRITDQILGAFYTTYDALGFGFLESVCVNALKRELAERGLSVKSEYPIDVFYKGGKIGHFRADLLVDNSVIVEAKASRQIDDADHKQVLNYLRGSTIEVGLLLHFGPKPNFRRLFFDQEAKARLTAPTR